MTETPVPDWEYRSELTLAALPNAVACARLLVAHTLTDSQVDGQSVRAAEQATKELVAHAVATTGVTAAVPIYDAVFEHLALLSVHLRLTPEQVQIEVWDSSAMPPHPRLGQAPAIQASAAWGYDLPSSGVRVVWCVLPVISRTDHTELPRRVPQRIPRQEENKRTTPQRDPDLLQRVLDGLRRIDTPLRREDS
jgi:hypothetical protein